MEGERLGWRREALREQLGETVDQGEVPAALLDDDLFADRQTAGDPGGRRCSSPASAGPFHNTSLSASAPQVRTACRSARPVLATSPCKVAIAARASTWALLRSPKS